MCDWYSRLPKLRASPCLSRAYCATGLLPRWRAETRTKIGLWLAAWPRKMRGCRRRRGQQDKRLNSHAGRDFFERTIRLELRDTLKVSSHEACDDSVVGKMGAGDRSERGNWDRAGRGTGSRRGKSGFDCAAAGTIGRTGAKS